MWFKRSQDQDQLEALRQIITAQARTIHHLETSLALATGQPPPPPWPLPSRPPSPILPFSTKIRGAEAVTVLDREARREQELKAAVATAFKLPDYMAHPKPIPESQVPPGHGVGGGFSPPENAPPPNPTAA